MDAKKWSDLVTALKAHWDRRVQAWAAVAVTLSKQDNPVFLKTLNDDLAVLAADVTALAPNIDPLAL